MAGTVHIGGFKLKDDVSKEAIDEILEIISQFKTTVQGVTQVLVGKFNNCEWPQSLVDIYKESSDKLLTGDYDYGFLLFFESEVACKDYFDCDVHLEYTQKLAPLLANGVSSCLSLDLDMK